MKLPDGQITINIDLSKIECLLWGIMISQIGLALMIFVTAKQQ